MGTFWGAILLAQLLVSCFGVGDNVDLQSPPSVVPPTITGLQPTTPPPSTNNLFPGLGSRTIFPPNFGEDFVNRALGLTTTATTATTTTTTAAPFPGISVQRPIVLPTVFPGNFADDFLNRLFGRGNNASTTASATASTTLTTQSTVSATTATSSTTAPTATTATAANTATTATTTNDLISSAIALGNILINSLLKLLFGQAPTQG